jgi:octaprenyl-diphosphate synthase
MQALSQIKQQITFFIDELGDNNLNDLLAKLPSGKMLRSKLVLKIAGVSKQSINLCAIIELIHAASLLHDDVLDDAMTRRGQKSINAIYGNKTAIMFGDVLYSKGFFELSKLDTKIAQTISNAVTLLSIGEMQEINLTNQFNSSFDKYLDIIYKKTASLIEASAKSAAILSNKDEKSFGKYGKNLGIAFQMVDDILDITQDSKKLGKPAMQDFYEGKVTIPYLLLFDRLDEKGKEYLKLLYKKQLTTQEEQWLKTNLTTTNALQDAINLAKKYGYDGIQAIYNQNNHDLIQIMQEMIDRDY